MGKCCDAFENMYCEYRVMVKFVVGSEPCLLPVDDRLSAYSCEEWQVGLPGL